MRALLLASVLAAGVPGLAAAQEPATSRLEGRVSPSLQRSVTVLADSLAAQGLPVDALVRKAIEGSAKRVPEDRILAAVRTVATQLAEAREAARSAGASPDADAIEAGAYAINAGVSPQNIAALSRDSRQPDLLVASLRSSGTLVALGVPEGTAVKLVDQWVKSGRTSAEILTLPQQLQVAMAHGNSASAAAAEVAHGPPSTPGANGQGNRPVTPPGQAKGQDHSHRP